MNLSKPLNFPIMKGDILYLENHLFEYTTMIHGYGINFEMLPLNYPLIVSFSASLINDPVYGDVLSKENPPHNFTNDFSYLFGFRDYPNVGMHYMLEGKDNSILVYFIDIRDFSGINLAKDSEIKLARDIRISSFKRWN